MKADLVAQTLRSALATNAAAQTRFLAALVSAPSDNPPGDCAAHAELAAGLLEALGLQVERYPVPAGLAAANGMRSATNLVVRRRFGEGPVVVLNAHGDVVPPGEGWTTDPYGAAIIDGSMYGRGAAVSKSDFATYAFALLALEQIATHLCGTIELHFTYDEEAGGTIGPAWLLAEKLSEPDFAICAGFSYDIVTAHDGCLHLEVQVDGRSAHAAMPSTGIDALEVANAILTSLYESRKELRGVVSATPGIGSPQLTVGLINGGVNTNVVPDRVTFRLDRRIIPEEKPETVEAGLRQLIEHAAQACPSAKVTMRQILLARPLVPLAGAEPLIEIFCRHATAIMGEPVTAKGVPLYTDARHYAEAGIPVLLYGAGPHSIEEANAHRADERLPLSDLVKATEVVTMALAEFLRR